MLGVDPAFDGMGSDTDLVLGEADRFAGGDPEGIERALVSMYRKGRSTLTMWDLKFSNPEFFEMPAGPAGFLVGYEYRRETYVDNRDPRLDGTIRFMRESDPINAPGVFDIEGDFDSCDPATTPLGCSEDGFDTYPVTSDIVGASPTPDAGVGDYVIVHVGFAISRIDESCTDWILRSRRGPRSRWSAKVGRANRRWRA